MAPAHGGDGEWFWNRAPNIAAWKRLLQTRDELDFTCGAGVSRRSLTAAELFFLVFGEFRG